MADTISHRWISRRRATPVAVSRAVADAAGWSAASVAISMHADECDEQCVLDHAGPAVVALVTVVHARVERCDECVDLVHVRCLLVWVSCRHGRRPHGDWVAFCSCRRTVRQRHHCQRSAWSCQWIRHKVEPLLNGRRHCHQRCEQVFQCIVPGNQTRTPGEVSTTLRGILDGTSLTSGRDPSRARPLSGQDDPRSRRNSERGEQGVARHDVGAEGAHVADDLGVVGDHDDRPGSAADGAPRHGSRRRRSPPLASRRHAPSGADRRAHRRRWSRRRSR